MAVLNSNLQTAWTPEDYGKLIDVVIAEKSIAFKAGTVIQTASESIRFPMLTADPAVGWYAENTQITLTDPTTNELVVTPKAVKGLTQISNEAAEDSNPAVAEQVGRSLARSVAKKIDAAFFGNTVTNGPNGLLSLSGVNVVDTGTITLNTLDAFHQAKADALADGAELSVFVLAPDVALTLATAKQGTDLNTSLLTDVSDGVTITGIPVLVSTDVAAGNAWGMDTSQVLVVQRTGTTVTGHSMPRSITTPYRSAPPPACPSGSPTLPESSGCMTPPNAHHRRPHRLHRFRPQRRPHGRRAQYRNGTGEVLHPWAGIYTRTCRGPRSSHSDRGGANGHQPHRCENRSDGAISVTHAAPGFTIPELFVLNRYRDRAL